MSNIGKLLQEFKGQRDHRGLRCSKVIWEKMGYK